MAGSSRSFSTCLFKMRLRFITLITHENELTNDEKSSCWELFFRFYLFSVCLSYLLGGKIVKTNQTKHSINAGISLKVIKRNREGEKERERVREKNTVRHRMRSTEYGMKCGNWKMPKLISIPKSKQSIWPLHVSRSMVRLSWVSDDDDDNKTLPHSEFNIFIWVRDVCNS